MMIWFNIFFIVGGIFLLVKGADFLVKGASALAKRLGVSELVIGLTIVALGTSAPELIVSLMAGVQGHPELTISNILGSNIVNVLLILGLAALIFPLRISKTTVWREIPFSLLALAVLFLAAMGGLSGGRAEPFLSRTGGIILLALFGVFLGYTFYLVRSQKATTSKERECSDKKEKVGWSSLLIAGGLAGLIIGGRLVVAGSVSLSESIGLAERTIGLTVIAIGTSLPELVTSAVAAYRRKSDMAVGNIIGSSIMNVLLILGVSSVITPLPFYAGSYFDGWVAAGATIVLFVFMFIGRPKVLEKWQGAVLVVLYGVYLTLILLK